MRIRKRDGKQYKEENIKGALEITGMKLQAREAAALSHTEMAKTLTDDELLGEYSRRHSGDG